MIHGVTGMEEFSVMQQNFLAFFGIFWSDLCSLNTLFLCEDIMLRLTSAIDMFTCSMHFTGIPMLFPLIYFLYSCFIFHAF